MLSGKEISDLLHTLQGQFFRLTDIVLARRIETRRHSSRAHPETDITTPLSTQLEKLARDQKPKVTGSVPLRPIKTDPQHDGPKQDAQRKVINKTLNGLSRHIKQSKSSASPHPELGQKLQQSTWTHIHTSLRLARQGDVKLAMLHAELANSALKEAAKFISPDEYIKFVEEVKNQLDVFDEQKG